MNIQRGLHLLNTSFQFSKKKNQNKILYFILMTSIERDQTQEPTYNLIHQTNFQFQ